MRDPQTVAQKWARNLGMATDTIKAGIQAVTQSPTERAAQRQDAYIAGVQRAVASGKWQQGLRRVNLQDWQSAAINKGLPRIGPGAQQALPKFTTFMQQWLPYLDGLHARLQNLPRGDIEQNRARMNAAMDYLHAFRRTV